MTKQLTATLSPMHKLFADKYLETGHISNSARHAGYSEKSCHVSGHKVLKRPDVQQYLAEQGSKILGDQEDLQTKVLSELSTLAFANIANFIKVDKDGLPQVDFSTATPEQLKAITSIASKRKTKRDKDGNEYTETENRFTMSDKYRGLELLGKHTGMFKEAEQRIVVDVADRLLAARTRLRAIENGEAE